MNTPNKSPSRSRVHLNQSQMQEENGPSSHKGSKYDVEMSEIKHSRSQHFQSYGKCQFLDEKIAMSPLHRQKNESNKFFQKNTDGYTLSIKPKLNREESTSYTMDTQVYTKSVFNQKTKLPKIESIKSQMYYHQSQKASLAKMPSMPAILRNPGVVNKSQPGVFINKYEKKPIYIPYSVLESNYRNKNLIRDKVRLTSNLYSDLKWKLAGGKDFEIGDIENPNIIIDDNLERAYIKNQVQMQDDIEPIDSQQKLLEGPVAQDEYYKHYKMVDQIDQQNQFFKKEPSVFTRLLKSTSESRLMPIKYGVLSNSFVGNEKQCLNLKNYRLGNSYSQIALEGVKNLQFSQINLSENRLSGENIEGLISSINIDVQKIDLSKNNVSKYALSLYPHICQKKSNLKILNLHQCNLGDSSAIQIIEFCKTSITLVSLNLSDNKLTDFISTQLVQTVDSHPTLKEIYLRWNSLSEKFGKEFFGHFMQDENQNKFGLKVIDLGWNNLGKGLKVIKEEPVGRRGPVLPEVSLCIKGFLETNKTLLHLDLSSNKFRFDESKNIAEGLSKNYQVYGFHFEGNNGFVNSEGFLIVNEGDKDVSSEHYTRQINSVHRLDNYNKFYQQFEAQEAQNVCWICDGWKEIKFEYRKSVVGNKEIFIHFKHENYQAVYMRKQEGDEYPSVVLLVPNGRLFYFFMVDFEPEVMEEAPFVTLDESEEVRFNYRSEEFMYEINQFNFFEVTSEPLPLFDEYYDPVIITKPRFPRIFPEQAVVKSTWNFHASVFKEWKEDTEKLMDKCFDTDWQNSKCERFIKTKSERNMVIYFLKPLYKNIKDFYKHQSSFSAAQCFGLGANHVIELFNQMGATDSKYLNTAALGIEMTKCNAASSEEIKSKNNNKGLLCRFEFLEFIVRCSECKFMLSKETTSYSAAVNLFYNEFCEKFFVGYDSQKFRDEGYWTEEVDFVYKTYEVLLRHIYSRFSGLKTLPGKKPFMCVEELRQLINFAGIQELINERDVPLIFNLSMMTQVDELMSDRLMEMAYVEFLEAFARLADRVSLPGVKLDKKIVAGMSEEEKKSQKLSVKCEAFLQSLAGLLTPSVIKTLKLPKIGTSILNDQGMKPQLFQSL